MTEQTVSAFRTAFLGVAAAAAVAFAAQAAEINGAGATFPYPIYAKWAEAYAAKTGRLPFTYLLKTLVLISFPSDACTFLCY